MKQQKLYTGRNRVVLGSMYNQGVLHVVGLRASKGIPQLRLHAPIFKYHLRC